jgi:hypothetical protein
MSSYNGIAVYEILPDGCLNGVHTNDHTKTKNKIFNEIARKKDVHKTDTIEGLYTCCYIDLLSEPFICDLEIKNNSDQYEFIWSDLKTKKIKFKGKGWLTRENQLTVWWWDI